MTGRCKFRPSFSDYIILITYFQTRLHQILNIHHIQSLWATRKPSSIWGTFTRLQNKHFSVGFNCSWRDHSRTPECCLRLSMERGEGSINRDFVKRVGAECGEGLSDIGNRVTDGVADTPKTPRLMGVGVLLGQEPLCPSIARRQLDRLKWMLAFNLGEHMQKQPARQRRHESPFILMQRKDCKHCDNYRSCALTLRNASYGYLWNDSLWFLKKQKVSY